ncbi:hypothetical protein HRbin36_01756 [bacterium HR36]|nr:hypothetical protein HRbin36_01756 [bacterium HR36]
MVLRQGILISLVVALLPASDALADVGHPIDVAPMVSDSRNQVWAAAAWSAQAQCWLVAWREGYLNEPSCDIYCARLAADGTALDSKGICLSTPKSARNNRPRVACDGRDFLVVWEQYRLASDKTPETGDWDVVAKRVSADGIADKDTLIIAQGKHNQCRPDVTFARGYYLITWMGYEGSLYGVQAIRYLPNGKAVDKTPLILARHDPKGTNKSEPLVNALLPVLAADQQGHVLAAFYKSPLNVREHPGYFRHLAFRSVDVSAGKAIGDPPPPRPTTKLVPGTGGYPYEELAPALALGKSGALLVCRADSRRMTNKDRHKVLSLCRLSKSGEVISMDAFGSSLILSDSFYPLQMRPCVAFDGQTYLVVSDVLSSTKVERKHETAWERYVRILGWKVEEDGKLQTEDGFVVAGTPQRQCLLPAVAAGPQGTWLVVYSEVRGIDNVKVVGRVVK